MVDLDLAQPHAGDGAGAEACGRPGVRSNARRPRRPSGTAATASASSVVAGQEPVAQLGAARRRPAPRCRASRRLLEAYIGIGSPSTTPVERAGQALGVERQVGHHVGAGPAGQPAGRRPVVVVEAVDGADQALGGLGEAARARRRVRAWAHPARPAASSSAAAMSPARARDGGTVGGRVPVMANVFESDTSTARGSQWRTSSSSGAPGSTTSRTSRSTCRATP